MKTPPDRTAKGDFASLSINTAYSADSHTGAGDLSPEAAKNRRDSILKNSGVGQSSSSMKSMHDIISAIKLNMSSAKRSVSEQSDIMQEEDEQSSSDLLRVHSTTHYNTSRGIAKKPTFALRVLIQERLARIIAREVAGFQSNVAIKNNTLKVTIDSLKQTCEKWFIPRRATKAFRSVAFETLYFVGERQLIVRGVDAIFELTPVEMQGLYGPVLAAMGDAGTMEAWLNRTQILADTEFQDNADEMDFKLNLLDDRRVNQITQNMTAAPNTRRTVIGNAFINRN